MSKGHQPNRARDTVFFIFGLVGAVLSYHVVQWGMELYNWIVSTDIIHGIVFWWTTPYTVTIVPAELLSTLIGVLIVIGVLTIVMFFSITERPF